MKLKSILTAAILLISCLPGMAQYRIDRKGEKVNHWLMADFRLQMLNFAAGSESIAYGIGIKDTSITHWGWFHIGVEADFALDAGLHKYWGYNLGFGPSFRFDLSDKIFLNVPLEGAYLHAVKYEHYGYPYYERSTRFFWGGKITPTLYCFASERVGLFVGPQMMLLGNENSYECSIYLGAQLGVSYSF